LFETISVRAITFDYLVGGESIGFAQFLDSNGLVIDFGSDAVVFEIVSEFLQVLLAVVVAGGFAFAVGLSRLLVIYCVAFSQ
jgi:hypothetical protein